MPVCTQAAMDILAQLEVSNHTKTCTDTEVTIDGQAICANAAALRQRQASGAGRGPLFARSSRTSEGSLTGMRHDCRVTESSDIVARS